MTTPSTAAQPTAAQLEKVFRAALEAGDVESVHAALLLMAPLDPERAAQLKDVLELAVRMAAGDLQNALPETR